MTPDALLARLERAPRTASLIVTVWGDAVAPRGGSLWLGTLQAILDRFGVNPGQLRTAMSRLTEEGWLARNRVGRLSYYRLGPRGESAFGAASRRIYDGAPATWDGRFRLALTADPDLREALAAQGFAALAPGVLAGLAGELPSGAPVLLAEPRSLEEARQVAARAWPLDGVAEGYARFLDLFAPLAGVEPAPQDALPLRVLVVHEWRRVVLRDPRLPPDLLPKGWPGTQARALAARLYHALLPASEAWLDDEGRNEDGQLPPADRELASRFREAG
ncbi:MAG TPA: PaaX family transcriptional regulator C-terminal domain-containing protein [Acetobacteraceae bacterium]|jgi:phenylacetic acid degradation operon negative regulatory protein|nr:PaaX family transcriptional regulator C-terminal domain-containing protein [Acetobacteraceae bacterium]